MALSFTIAMSALQRSQPFDPPFQADFRAALTGDGSGGVAAITASLPPDIAAVPEYLSVQDESGVATDALFQMVLGHNPGPDGGPQQIGHQESSVLIATGAQIWFDWEPPRTMLIPDMGGSIAVVMSIVNPGASDDVNVHGRFYCWPRNEVINLPQRAFLAYLIH